MHNVFSTVNNSIFVNPTDHFRLSNIGILNTMQRVNDMVNLRVGIDKSIFQLTDTSNLGILKGSKHDNNTASLRVGLNKSILGLNNPMTIGIQKGLQHVNNITSLQVGLNKSILGLDNRMNIGIPKGMQHVNNISSLQVGLDKSILRLNNPMTIGIPKGLQHVNKIASLQVGLVPQSALNSLSIIERNHLRINDLDNSFLKKAGYHSASTYQHGDLIALSKYTSLRNTVNLLSDRLIDFHAKTKQWDSLEEFADISSKITCLVEKFSTSDYVTKEDIETFQANLINICNETKDETLNIKEEISNIKINIKNDIKNKIGFWIGVWGIFMPSVWDIMHKPDYATKSDIETLNRSIHEMIRPNAIQLNLYRNVSNNCKVYVKPNSKSYIITTIDSNSKAVVLQNSNEWFYISYIDEKDSLVKNGWVLKKYMQISQQ